MIFKKRSIFFNLFAQYVFIIVIFTSLIVFTSYRLVINNYIKNVTKELETNALLLSTIALEQMINNEYEVLNNSVGSYGTILEKRITIIKSDGTVISDSAKDYRTMENHADRPEFIEAFNTTLGSSIRLSSTLKLQMLYVAVPVYHNNTIIGVIRISEKLADIKKITRAIRSNLILLGLLVLVILSAFSFVMSRKFSKPIQELSFATNKVAKGCFDVNIFSTGKTKEMQVLEKNFTIMTNKLKDLFHELRCEKEELNSIISSVEESIIILNEDGKIVRTNNSFNKLFAVDDAHDHFYWQIIKNPEIKLLLDKLNDTRVHVVKEILLDDKTLLVSINYLQTITSYILIFSNISELKNIENMKKDFVANVSHELRTPLTSISGFTETLLEEEHDTVKRNQLEIINRNAQRLINIVKDLLILAELEKDTSLENKDLSIEKVNLNTLFASLFKMFEKRLKEKNIEFFVEINEKGACIDAYANKLEHIFINLIDNAVKYTDSGKIKILVKYNEKKPDMVTIRLSDTGIGMQREHLKRIFERFYVVDKSRSKKNGGTGLGLSIVKHDVMLHKGTINVKSKVGKGTVFVIDLPVTIT